MQYIFNSAQAQTTDFFRPQIFLSFLVISHFHSHFSQLPNQSKKKSLFLIDFMMNNRDSLSKLPKNNGRAQPKKKENIQNVVEIMLMLM